MSERAPKRGMKRDPKRGSAGKPGRGSKRDSDRGSEHGSKRDPKRASKRGSRDDRRGRGSGSARPRTPLGDARRRALAVLLDFDAAPFPLAGKLEAEQARIDDPEERHLFRRLVAEVVRHRSRLDWWIEGALSKGSLEDLHPPIRNILRLGAAQHIRFDRVPPHAVVDTSVELAKRHGHPGTAGLVNAVLRRLDRERGRWTSLDTEPPAGADNAGWLALRTSHPRWLVERWLDRWGEARTRRFLEWNQEEPDLSVRLASGIEAPAGATRSWVPASVRLPAGSAPQTWEGFARGEMSIQDPAATLIGWLPPVVEGRVLDACAAPGTKTMHLLERAAPGARIVATDLSAGRLRRLRRGMRRSNNRSKVPPADGTTSAASTEATPATSSNHPDDAATGSAGPVPLHLLVADARALPFAGVWDGILIDAPCSNLGVLRRRADVRWRVHPEEITRLASIQRAMLRAAAGALAPGGWLVYSVCTIESEETEEQRRGFFEENPEFEPLPLPDFVPESIRIGMGEMSMLPGEAGTDGGYAFLARRRAKR